MLYPVAKLYVPVANPAPKEVVALLPDMTPAIVNPPVPLIMPMEYMLSAERPMVLRLPVMVSPDNFTKFVFT